MYIIINKGAKMSTGKSIAQGAHAACKAVEISKPHLVEAWNKYGFYTKLVLEARDAKHLQDFKQYLEERNILSVIIIDEGRTEIKKHTPTALGIEIVDKNEFGPIFKELNLYKDKIKVTVEFEK
jgi:peptidyl-tRNA hydrolase